MSARSSPSRSTTTRPSRSSARTGRSSSWPHLERCRWRSQQEIRRRAIGRVRGHGDRVRREDAHLLRQNKNLYTRVEVPGSLDDLVNELQKKFDRPLPAADLFITHAYDEITAAVTNVKDLGSGVVGGIECDYFAFRAKDVDWQIWVTQGAKPRPCRYIITSTEIARRAAITPSSFGTGRRPASRGPSRTSRSSHRPVRSE